MKVRGEFLGPPRSTDKKANLCVAVSKLLDLIWFVHLIFMYATTLPFKLK